ncbi:sodium:neurotransmitter symporter [Roseivirga seohaensis subsp. aquiponti]|uniref:Sodium:neurotransmitter symporter n=2 Tax=Roseivirga seohaensis TaxID=1914963 RepID=A0A0L8AJY5_9BACT|nr:sodium-dependent transporter [Roseivirga seohaensis]KOF02490.1 sodium:neurotransmitter symporter [Roseivirga seohaensis subsp. aquiponti]
MSTQEKPEEFSNRWGIILAALGMAIGAGNLWRFPRIAGEYGGTFIILWMFFLVIWSIPLLMAELAIGKHYKKGTIGALGSLSGKKFNWMGVFVTLVTMGIAFYYSVVTGWSFRYFLLNTQNLVDYIFGSGAMNEKFADPNVNYMDNFWAHLSNSSWEAVLCYMFTIAIAIWVLSKGIKQGLEKVNKILIPTLFILLMVVAAFAIQMPGGVKGLEYLFTINVELFKDPNIWIQAITDSAWSTGAGWGLMITIGSFSRKKEDVTLNTFLGAFGNNSAALLAAMAILPAVFAMSATSADAIDFLHGGNTALVFTVLPQLFSQMTGGPFLSWIFFGAFAMAAFSSVLPMMQLIIRNLTDYNISKKQAALITGAACFIIGFPSAWSLAIFENQDWVWGVGLLVSGIFISFLIMRYGPSKFKRDFIDENSDFKVSSKYFTGMIYFIFFAGLFLVYWWMDQGYSKYPWFDEKGNWNVFDTFSNASIVTQWAIALIIAIVFNGWFYKKFVKK